MPLHKCWGFCPVFVLYALDCGDIHHGGINYMECSRAGNMSYSCYGGRCSDFCMDIYIVDSDEALNASSLQFLSIVKRFIASSLRFLLSVKCFIAVIFTGKHRLTLHCRYFLKEIYRLTLHRHYFLK
jgi:hypothetical protein